MSAVDAHLGPRRSGESLTLWTSYQNDVVAVLAKQPVTNSASANRRILRHKVRHGWRFQVFRDFFEHVSRIR